MPTVINFPLSSSSYGHTHAKVFFLKKKTETLWLRAPLCDYPGGPSGYYNLYVRGLKGRRR